MPDKIKVGVSATPLTRLFDGKEKFIYRLSDFSYGEWIIFEDEEPRYYLYILDDIYEKARAVLKREEALTVEALIQRCADTRKMNLSTSQPFYWCAELKSEERPMLLELEQFPPDFFDIDDLG